MSDASFRPLVAFNDQSKSFTLGFEAGMVWQQMQDSKAIISNGTPYHSENAHGVFQAMADAAGYDIEAVDCEDTEGEWTEVVFTRRPIVRDHLSLVSNADQPS